MRQRVAGFNKKMLIPVVVAMALIGLGAAYVLTKDADVDESNLPKFVTANFVNLDTFLGVSKFRSAVGHDFGDSYESCRSLKHYFMPKQQDTGSLDNPATIPANINHSSNIPVFSPVTGKIIEIQTEQHPLGKQFFIVPSGYQEFTVRLFHIYPLDTIKGGQDIKAGERIGSILPYQQTDIAVTTQSILGSRSVSYFNVMNDKVFDQYKARGFASRQTPIITKAERNANPLQCNGQEFVQKDFNASDWVFFDGVTNPFPENRR